MELIKKTLPVDEANGWYLTNTISKPFTEEFKDEETGEIVTIERQETIIKRGVCLTPIDVSVLKENGITEVGVSNIPILGYQEKNLNLWETVLKTHSSEGDKKRSYIVTADSPAAAEQSISDWMQMNIKASFEIIKAAQVEYNKVIKMYETERDEYEEDGKHSVKWYKCQIYSIIGDYEETGTTRGAGSKNILIQAKDFEKAIEAVKAVLNRNEFDARYNTFKAMQELTVSEVFIPDESVSYYSENEI
ncbi:MAG: DUF4494 family protein [Tannerellaceae bacterium]|jgi:hypothetical protein|nr:DUF4494 family protein [Tannerellaceae bacterium]